MEPPVFPCLGFSETFMSSSASSGPSYYYHYRLHHSFFFLAGTLFRRRLLLWWRLSFFFPLLIFPISSFSLFSTCCSSFANSQLQKLCISTLLGLPAPEAGHRWQGPTTCPRGVVLGSRFLHFLRKARSSLGLFSYAICRRVTVFLSFTMQLFFLLAFLIFEFFSTIFQTGFNPSEFAMDCEQPRWHWLTFAQVFPAKCAFCDSCPPRSYGAATNFNFLSSPGDSVSPQRLAVGSMPVWQSSHDRCKMCSQKHFSCWYYLIQHQDKL